MLYFLLQKKTDSKYMGKCDGGATAKFWWLHRILQTPSTELFDHIEPTERLLCEPQLQQELVFEQSYIYEKKMSETKIA